MKLRTAHADDLHSGGNYLTDPGTYHFVVDKVDVGLSKNGKGIDGNTLHLTCLAGTSKDCSNKKLDIVLWNPDYKKSEKSVQMTERQLTAFYFAVNSLTKDQLGAEVDIDEERPAQESEQFIAKLVRSQKKNENDEWVDDPEGNLKWSYDDIWHVDDPKCKEAPKNESALKIIPKEKRHDAAWFGCKPTGSSTQASGFDVSAL